MNIQIPVFGTFVTSNYESHESSGSPGNHGESGYRGHDGPSAIGSAEDGYPGDITIHPRKNSFSTNRLKKKNNLFIFTYTIYKGISKSE